MLSKSGNPSPSSGDLPSLSLLSLSLSLPSDMPPFVRLAANSSADVLLSSSSFWASLDSRSLIFESIVFILSSRMKKSWTFLFIVFLNTENIEDGFDASCSSFFNFSISSRCCFNNWSLSDILSPSFFLFNLICKMHPAF